MEQPLTLEQFIKLKIEELSIECEFYKSFCTQEWYGFDENLFKSSQNKVDLLEEKIMNFKKYLK